MSLKGLVDREAELRIGLSLLDGATVGRGRLLLVEGPAGIGKTRLLAALRELADARGLHVLSASGAELERDFPFGAVRQLFAHEAARERLFTGGAAHARAVLDPERAPGTIDAEYATLHGLYWLVVALAERAPLLVCLDDVHWVDAASLRFIAFLARRLEGLRVLVCGALRPAEPGTDPTLLSALALGAELIVPAPLSRAGVAELIGAAPEPAFVDACLSLTGGNPFYLQTLIAEAASRGIRATEAGIEPLRSIAPEGLARRLLHRLESLGPGAPELARALAVLGDGTSLGQLARLAGLETEAATAAAAALERAAIADGGERLAFVHPVVRGTVYSAIGSALRGEQHARAARMLEDERADRDRVAAQLLLTQGPPEPWAVERLRGAAARAMASGAPENAAAYLRRTLDAPADAELRSALLRELAAAETVLQDRAAIEHLEQARALTADPLRRAAVAANLVEVLVYIGQWDAGVALAEAALAEIDHGEPTALRLQAMWATAAVYDPRLVGALEPRLEELRASADRGGAAGRPLMLLLAALDANRGERLGEIVARVERGLDDGRFLADEHGHAWALPQALMALMYVDELDRAAALADAMVRDARAQASVRGYIAAGGMRMHIRAQAGDLAGTAGDLPNLLALAQETSMLLGIPSALRYASDAILERPELADLEALAEQVELPPGFAGTVSGAYMLEVRGRLKLARGDADAAAALLRRAGETYAALSFRNPVFYAWRSWLALAVGGAEGRALVADELADARRTGLPRAIGVALRTIGILDDDVDTLREAVDVLAGSPARLEHARALVELGSALRRANQRLAAREPLRAGLDAARRCGAIRLAERAAIELRAAGARPRREVLSGPDALTASERRTAEMAAAGLSNPEIAQALFVTIKTVEGHLSGAYRKLEVRSRTELPTALGVRP
jgi:DNA-binding CsgD family transcriptional regulator